MINLNAYRTCRTHDQKKNAVYLLIASAGCTFENTTLLNWMWLAKRLDKGGGECTVDDRQFPSGCISVRFIGLLDVDE